MNEPRLNRREFIRVASGASLAALVSSSCREDKLGDSFLDHPLFEIARVEAKFRGLTDSQLEDYIRELSEIRDAMLRDKAGSSEHQLEFMHNALLERGYEISHRRVESVFFLYDALRERCLGCNQVNALIGTVAREDRGMDITPSMAMSPALKYFHAVLTVNGEDGFRFEPLVGKRLRDDNYDGEFSLEAPDLSFYDLKKDGFLLLAYNAIGTHYYRELFDAEKIRDGKKIKDCIQKSRRALEWVVKTDPDFPIGHWNLGSLFFRMRNYEKAREEFMAALPMMNKYPYILTQIGECCVKKMEYTKAREWFEKALELCNKYQGIYMDKIPRLERAIKVLDQAGVR